MTQEATAIPKTKFLLSGIEVDTTTFDLSTVDVSVKKLLSDHLAERTASHNIVGDNPIVGNAPTLTLLGDLQANKYRILNPSAKHYIAADTPTLLSAATEHGNYGSYLTYFIIPSWIAIGSVLRVSYAAKRLISGTPSNLTLHCGNWTAAVFTDVLADAFQTFTHDVFISGDTVAASDSQMVRGAVYIGFKGGYRLKDIVVKGAEGAGVYDQVREWDVI